MEKGLCKEAEAQLRVAVEVHYSMDPSNQDMQVGRTRGQVEVVVGIEDAAVDANMVDLDLDLENRKAVVENYKEERFEYIQTLLVAEQGVQAVVENYEEKFDYILTLQVAEEEAGMQEPGVVEKDWVYVQFRLASGDWILEADEHARLKDKYTHLNSYYPGN